MSALHAGKNWWPMINCSCSRKLRENLVRAGYFADVLVINPATLKDHATYQKPEILSEGMDYVIVNGRMAIGAG